MLTTIHSYGVADTPPQKMDKEEVLKKIEELKAFVQKCDEKRKENYCVGSYKKVRYDDNDLIFGNGARVESRYEGDGIFMYSEIVDRIVVDGNEIVILLKGNNAAITGETIWKNGN